MAHCHRGVDIPGSTTFSEIMSGPRKNTVAFDPHDFTKSTEILDKISNSGYAVVSQSDAIEETLTATSTCKIIIPPDSQIVSMYVIVTTAFGTGLLIGTQPFGVFRQLAESLTLSAVGVYAANPVTGDLFDRWKNINNTLDVLPGESVEVSTDCSSDGAGRGVLTISYIPCRDYALKS